MMDEFKINEPILMADDNFQVYNLRSNESINLKQLESKIILTSLEINSDKNRIGYITGNVDTNDFISIVNAPVLLNKGINKIKVRIYNNSYFKGISINKGDVIGTLIID